jgi:hypothetical protein
MYGQVYKITFADKSFYIGSTVRDLKKRLREHEKQKLKVLEENTKNGYLPRTRFDIYLTQNGWNNPTIECIRECQVGGLKELHAIEKKYVLQHSNDLKILNDCWMPPTEMQKVCHLEGLLNRPVSKFIERWVSSILDNWEVPGIFSSYRVPLCTA